MSKRSLRLVSLLLLILVVSACTPEKIENPLNLPVYPNATEFNDTANEYPANEYHYIIVDSDMQVVMKYYKEEMRIAGWELFNVGDVSMADIEAYKLLFEKDKAVIQLDILVWKDAIHIIGTRIE